MNALMNLMVYVAFFMYCCSDMYDTMCTAFLLLTVLIFVVNQTVVLFETCSNSVFVMSYCTCSSRSVTHVCNLLCVHPVVMHLNSVMLVSGATE